MVELKGIETKLSDTKRLELFGLAVKFQITEYIAIEHRGAKGQPFADAWAITSRDMCYSKRNTWVDEQLPSNRTNRFIQETRYTLEEAYQIVTSERFEQHKG